MTKTTEVLEEPDVCSSVDLESSSESKAEGAGRSAADAEEPSPPADGPSCSPQKPSEVRGLARSAPRADVPVERTAQHLPISRKGLSLKVFELLPEELILWLGVILPLFVLAVGYLAYFSEFGINPIPTVWHGLVVGIVPVANLLVWEQMRNRSLSTPKWLVHLNGMAIGVSLIYTLQYGWLLPVGILLTLFLIGLMALCPVLALLCSLACRGYLCTANAQSGKHRLPGVSVGIALSLVLLGLPFVASLMSECGLHLAGSNSRQQRQQGLDWLRQWGDRRYLLRSCYQQPDATIEWLGSVITDAFPIDTSRARKVYYQVTGDPFQSVELKEGRFARWWQTRPDFDEDQGGTVVGRPAEDLSLQTSRMEVFIDPEVSLANIEWTLVMKNDSWRNQEARVQIALPPGGVVSRVTLWVNGKERDAVVATKARAREAYQRVVQQRRDPILVTTHGPDRVLVQCFPVPPRGRQMKFRLGITAPVKLESLSQGYLRLPYFEEENFTVGDEKIHRLRIQTNRAAIIAAEPLQRVYRGGASAIWQGRLTDAELTSPRSVLGVQRSATSLSAWTANPFSTQQTIIWQSVQEKKISSPNRMVLVVDTSASMTRFIPQVADSLSALPTGTEIGVLVVSDGGAEQMAPLQLGTEELFRTLAERLKAVRCAGGKSNIPALLQAWDLAVASPTGMIVWVHGPIPELAESTDPLLELSRETDDRPRFVEVQSERGPNRLAEEINNADLFEPITRRSSLSADLREVFFACSNQSKQTEVSRRSGSRPPKNAVRVNAKAGWATACLWAHDEISRLLASDHPDENAALTLARRYQLVSPISGAVVLETDQQYVSAGLIGGNQSPAPPGAPPPAWPDALAFSSPAGSGLVSGGGEVAFDLRSMWSQSGSDSDKEALMLIPVAFLLIAKLLLRGPMIRIPFEN